MVDKKSKIVSFGDSFIFGYEIEGNYDGSAGWPSVVAKKLDVNYECKASPGSSNQSILRRILEYYSNEKNLNDLAVINWTWAHRWAYFINKHNLNTWINFGPKKINSPLVEFLEVEHLNLKTKDFSEIFKKEKRDLSKNLDDKWQMQLQQMYLEYISDNEMLNKFNSLQSLYCAVSFMIQKNIKFVQTNMDSELFETKWFCDGYISELQKYILPHMNSFDGLNFLDWSREKNFKITKPGWHPLEDAHHAAAEYWLPTYKKLLNID